MAGRGTNSKTLADLLPRAAEMYGDAPAVRYKEGGQWVDRSFDEVREIVRPLALGLVELGVEKGDRVSILGNTRPEWTYFDFAALSIGATVVPIYQTNSPEECRYVLENSDAKVVVVEDAEQLEKVREVRDQLPQLEHVVLMTGDAEDAISMDDLAAKGAGGATPPWEARYEAVTPADICTFIYTSGTTGPPKGCIISHGNYRAMLDMVNEASVIEDEDVTYLYLPLAHSFALLIQLGSFDLGTTLAYWERDPLKILPNLAELKPTYFPSVPRIFEKIYTAATSAIEKEGGLKKAIFDWAIKVGGEDARGRTQRPQARLPAAAPVRLRRQAGAVENPRPLRRQDPPRGLRRGADQPGDPALLRRRRRARARGLGDDRDLDRGDDLHPRGLQGRDDRQTVPRLRGEDRRRRRDPRQGPQRLPGLPQEPGGDAARRSSTAGSTPATSARSTPTASSRSPAAKRTSSSPRAARTSPRPTSRPKSSSTRWSPSAWSSATAAPTWWRWSPSTPKRRSPTPRSTTSPRTPPQLAANPDVKAAIEAHVDKINQNFARVEQVKKIAILPHDLSQESGELTPTLKVKRAVVAQKHEDAIEELYAA